MNEALGLIETKGLISAIEAADAMAKAADIKIVSREKSSAALITIKITGEVAAVKAALDAGSAAAKRVGQLVSAHIIPRPHDDLKGLIENKKKVWAPLKKDIKEIASDIIEEINDNETESDEEITEIKSPEEDSAEEENNFEEELDESKFTTIPAVKPKTVKKEENSIPSLFDNDFNEAIEENIDDAKSDTKPDDGFVNDIIDEVLDEDEEIITQLSTEDEAGEIPEETELSDLIIEEEIAEEEIIHNREDSGDNSELNETSEEKIENETEFEKSEDLGSIEKIDEEDIPVEEELVSILKTEDIGETEEPEEEIVEESVDEEDIEDSDSIEDDETDLGEEKIIDTDLNSISLDELQKMSVPDLRRLARSIEDFPIKGRDISKANKNELLDHFRTL
ncbi:MAG: BMC domain-containing protein [Melioribacteraceae bacterium]|nr:BMC domain-containing protein [Melioribacteraceae bacterium]